MHFFTRIHAKSHPCRKIVLPFVDKYFYSNVPAILYNTHFYFKFFEILEISQRTNACGCGNLDCFFCKLPVVTNCLFLTKQQCHCLAEQYWRH